MARGCPQRPLGRVAAIAVSMAVNLRCHSVDNACLPSSLPPGGSAGTPGTPPPQSAEEAEKREHQARAAEESRQAILAAHLDPAARARLARVALVKPDVARTVENMVMGAVQRGALQGRVAEGQIVDLLEKAGGTGEGGGGGKITFQRKRAGWDDDSD